LASTKEIYPQNLWTKGWETSFLWQLHSKGGTLRNSANIALLLPPDRAQGARKFLLA
jgi:hypothetical protein